MKQNKKRLKKRLKVCILISGPDSYAMLYGLTRKFYYIYPLYIKFGMVWEKAELYWIKFFLKQVKIEGIKKLKVIKFNLKGILGKHWSVSGKGFPLFFNPKIGNSYIPGRNIFLLSIASLYASENGIENIALGVFATTMHPDCSNEFFSIMEKTLNTGLKNKKIHIITPFLGKKKEEIIKKYKNIPFDMGFSCMNPQEVYHCGYCHKCKERQLYFKKAGIVDVTIYKKSQKM